MRRCLLVLLGALVAFWLPGPAEGVQSVTLEVAWEYDPPGGRQVVAYALYKERQLACAVPAPVASPLQCRIDVTRPGPASFTLTAFFADGSESSHFAPYTILLPAGLPEERFVWDVRLWVSSFYVAYWGRAADPDGMGYWVDLVRRGELDIPGVAENFALSDEARAMYPYFNSPGTASDADRVAFVRSVYANLLNREVSGDDAGVRYWAEVLRTGQSPPGLVIGYMIHAAIQEDSTDWQTIWNKIRVADSFTQSFQAQGRPWQPSDTTLARQALANVTHDPISVVVARFQVDQSLSR